MDGSIHHKIDKDEDVLVLTTLYRRIVSSCFIVVVVLLQLRRGTYTHSKKKKKIDGKMSLMEAALLDAPSKASVTLTFFKIIFQMHDTNKRRKFINRLNTFVISQRVLKKNGYR